MPEPETSKVWIRTVPGEDGVYRAVLEIDDDTSFALTAQAAQTYATAILGAVAVAEFEAAVVAQLTGKMGLPMDVAAQMLSDLRKDRPPAAGVCPLVLVPGVSARTGAPFLTVTVRGRPVGQWTPADAREHALFAMQAPMIADLDGAYLRQLKAIDVDGPRAMNVVGDLVNHRQEATL